MSELTDIGEYYDGADRFGFVYHAEQKMRNTIKVIDRDVPKIRIRDMGAGQMFRYPKAADDNNIYMQTDVRGKTILLSTGAAYSDMNLDAEVIVIDAINISR